MALVSFKRGTQAQFDAATKNADTLYFTTDSGKLFLGSTPIAEEDIKINKLTQSAYDALTTKNANILYIATDSGRIFLGSVALAEGEYQFDVIQSYESSITTGKFTLTCRGDTRTSLIVGVKATSAMTFYSISGTYDTTTKLTTYTATNTSRAGGVYLFNAGFTPVLATTGTTLTANQAAGAIKILPFEISMETLAAMNWEAIA
ncbi:MAG: hypothetical protein Pg6C_01920 [Treponemataceae bacterium]|nr:MAG: hypothetical protein Pg6C_01920 [Treponemataceae bacterium]